MLKIKHQGKLCEEHMGDTLYYLGNLSANLNLFQIKIYIKINPVNILINNIHNLKKEIKCVSRIRGH